MLHEPAIIHVESDTKLITVLKRAAEEPVVLEANGVRYHLSRESTPSPDAPEATLEGEPISADDPLWNIIGMVQSEEDGPTDVSQNKYRYLADAYAPKSE
jgi:hypothetical protein